MVETQRVLDPIHGLIVFRLDDEVDQLAWQLINTREFQRLRRIRQLGFSELVFPGATHTRFTHCIGVFHTARQLLAVIEREISNYDDSRAITTACAALLHDLGHGPFSHTFENVEKARGVRKRHEDWTADLIKGDTEVHVVLDTVSADLADNVAELLTQREPRDIYAAVVSSQFDADRLDYLRRDRYMTGVGTGAFDFHWLLDCLQVGKITVGEERDYVEVDGLYLNNKGLQAAEGYLLARFHLYSQVYMHKTTRGAEKMLGSLLTLVSERVAEDDLTATGLSTDHPIVRYFVDSQETLEAYFALDDSLLWTSLAEMSHASDEGIARLASGLHNRKLYKCFDVGTLVQVTGGDSLQRFRKRMQESEEALGLESGTTMMSDEVTISAYGYYGFDDPGALQKVLIGEQDKTEDIAVRSKVVAAIPEERIFRVYVPDREAVARLSSLWKEVTG